MSTTSIEQNKALVRHYLEEVWDKGNMAVIDECIAADYVQHSPGVPPGREGVKQFFNALRGAFPDVQNTIDDMVAEGDRVVWRSTITATHTGPFRGIPATGKQVKITALNLVRIANGYIAENWGEQDNLGLMQQLGVVPPPGGPGRG